MQELGESSPNAPTTSGGTVPRRIVFYTVGVTVGVVIAFVVLLANLPHLEDSNPGELLTRVFVMSLGVMFMGGALGGCLYSFRGLTKHSADQDYAEGYNLSYYLRPMAGGISGLMVFFLLLGGAMTLNLGSDGSFSWATFSGRMPYIAFAILAGYGSQEFMLKLKDLAESLFALSKPRKSE